MIAAKSPEMAPNSTQRQMSGKVYPLGKKIIENITR